MDITEPRFTEENRIGRESSHIGPAVTASEPHRFSVTIGKKPQEVFDFWRDFKNLSFFMKDLADVQILSDKTSHWILKLQSGVTAEWDAEIIEEIPGQMISWQSLEGTTVQNAGIVWFETAAGGRGTIVRLTMTYHVPGGKLTELASQASGEDPYNLTLTNLRRLKAYLETGEIPTTEGQPSGRDKGSKKLPIQELSTVH